MIRQAANELDEQKQENLLLKETIDRMRYDLDALRAGMGPSADGRQAQGDGTLSRSLANEIREGFERREREREKEEEEEAAEGIVVEEGEGEGSDDGYIETTITTSRKRVSHCAFNLYSLLTCLSAEGWYACETHCPGRGWNDARIRRRCCAAR